MTTNSDISQVGRSSGCCPPPHKNILVTQLFIAVFPRCHDPVLVHKSKLPGCIKSHERDVSFSSFIFPMKIKHLINISRDYECYNLQTFYRFFPRKFHKKGESSCRYRLKWAWIQNRINKLKIESLIELLCNWALKDIFDKIPLIDLWLSGSQ